MRLKRIVHIVLFSLLLLGGTVLCIFRWKAWFGNAPEPLYLVPPAPSNIVITPGADATTQRVIAWRADTALHSSGLILSRQNLPADTFPATGRIVVSRSGKEAFYAVCLDSLTPGIYSYRVFSGLQSSPSLSFRIPAPSDSLHVLLFGDIQEKDTLSPFSSFMADHSFSNTDLFAYVGDLIERPTDAYWQVFFASTHGTTASVPQLAVPGNHEYLKGVRKRLDSRWTSVFPYPQNGPRRFLGSSCYVDYPSARFIMINTDGLQLFSDYIITQVWLNRVLMEAGDRWKIVVMHHPVYSAGMGRDNGLIYLNFRGTLSHADLIFSGHDHNYARRTMTHHDSLCAPVYVVTSSASKFYLPKCDPRAQRLGSNLPFYEELTICHDTLTLVTRRMDTDERYDECCLCRNRKVLVGDSLPQEVIEMPERYRKDTTWLVRRFLSRRHERLNDEN